MNLKFGVIGAGNMAEAIIRGILRGNLIKPSDISIFDISDERLSIFSKLGLVICQNNEEVVKKSDVILLAVKPQVIGKPLDEIKAITGGKCLLTIAAGITSSFIHNIVCDGTYVVRAMPNTPLMVSCGATAIANSPETPKELFDFCVSVFEASGLVEFLEENQINEITAINGSSPAYFYRMVEALALSAENLGIPKQVAVKMAAKAMEGSAKMILTADKTPVELIQQVTSPNGTTMEALKAFDECHFEEMIDRAVEYCTRRAYELAE